MFSEWQPQVSKITVQLNDLKECSRTRNLERGKQVHAEATECGHDCNTYISNALINMYAKCSSMVHAAQVFDGMKKPTVVSWTALILGYADNGQDQTALQLFTRMRTEGPASDPVTLVAVLKACSSPAIRGSVAERSQRIKIIYNIAVENTCFSDFYLQSTFVDVYAKCGSMVHAREVFDGINHPNVVSYTALILGYADNGQGETALDLLAAMRTFGPTPNYVTIVAGLKACLSIEEKRGASRRERCNEIHNIAVQNGFHSNHYVQSTLVDTYAKCGSMVDARQVFDDMKNSDVVSWNVLILGYADNCQGDTALDMFTSMRTEGPPPDSLTLVAALKACTSLCNVPVVEADIRCRCKDIGKEVHNIAVEKGYNSEAFLQSTLIDMYAKSGSMMDAREVFDCLKLPDVVSWSALILGFVDNGQGHTALSFFIRMKTEGPAPNCVTYRAALRACILVGELELGRQIHSELNSKIDLDNALVNCLVDFYAKCGSLVEAQNVFDLHSETRDMITWNALLAGYSNCGDTKAVFGLFERMQDAGFKPDGITFLCILTCCSHAGVVVIGKKCFDEMFTKYGVVPSVKHYTCMIDLFGRANRIEDALALLDDMPWSPNDVTWMTLLGACRKWKNGDIGKLVFQSLN